MKILHSADWHLDSPFAGHSEENQHLLRRLLRRIPDKLADLCIREKCDLVVLCGDLFDGIPTPESLHVLRSALRRMEVPVVIAPGNHDFCSPNSPYSTEEWPENVHIFTKPQITSLAFPELDARIYGAGYEAMDCPGLLKDFQRSGNERWHIGALHGEISISSPYCPMTKDQIRQSGLDYLALGHIHKAGSLRCGKTLSAWSGCPMGRGYDELGIKGAIIAEFSEDVRASFVALDTVRFYDEVAEVDSDPLLAVTGILPATQSADFYRVTLTGYCSQVDLQHIRSQFPHIPNLILRDETLPELDLWSCIDEDSFEGVYFGILHHSSQSDSETICRRARLAARISRQLLDDQEVRLP